MDTGYFMADERSAHGRLRPDIAVKNDWVMKAYGQFPVDVVNVSSHDLRYFADAFVRTEFVRRSKTEPMLDRLVSANTVSESAAIVAPHPFIIRELPSRHDGLKPVRVAFIGLTETTPAAPPGFKLIDPAEAARRTVPEARKSADLVVVLAKVNATEAARIAREAPGIDVIIAGNAESLTESFTPPVLSGSTLIAFTPFETRMLGELRFYRSAQGKFSTRQRFIALDETLVPEDPAAKVIVEKAATAESDARGNSKKLLEAWLGASRTLITSRPPDGDARTESLPRFVTSAACSQCHVAQYLKWANSAHAHATDPLPPRAIEFEASCMDCHSTGSKPASVASGLETARLQSVQCEQCHGAGGDHVRKPGKGYGRIDDMKSSCASCHTAETSPAFDLQTAWAQIKH